MRQVVLIVIKKILLIAIIVIAGCSSADGLPSIEEIPVPELAKNVKKGKGLAYMSYQVSYELQSLFPNDGYSDFTNLELLNKGWEKCKDLSGDSTGWGPFIDATSGQSNQIVFNNIDVYKHTKNKQLLFISGRFNSENYSAEGKLQNIEVVIVVNNLEKVGDIIEASKHLADCQRKNKKDIHTKE